MKFLQLACVLLGLALNSAAAQTVDLARIDRSIRREPAYRSTPRYCLLVFGPRAEHRVWLILDGDSLYVDRDGNGDLTEKGKQVAVEKWEATSKPHPAYSQEKRTRADNLRLGGLTHTDLIVVQTQYRRKIGPSVKDANDWQASVDDIWRQTGDGITCMVYLDLDPRCYPFFKAKKNDKLRHCSSAEWKGGYLAFGRSPREAPVLHFGGPLTFRVAQTEFRRAGTPDKLIANLGTVGLGRGAFVEMNYDLVPDDLDPVIEVEFPAGKRGASPLVKQFVLDDRC
jgi:hypothetical protein